MAIGGPVDQNDRHTFECHGLKKWVIATRCSNDEAINTTGPQRVDVGDLALIVIVGIRQQRDVTTGREDVLDAPNDRREQRVGQIGQHNADGRCARSAQTLSQGVRRVSEPLRYGANPTYGLLADPAVGRRIEGARRSGLVDACGFGDVLESRGTPHVLTLAGAEYSHNRLRKRPQRRRARRPLRKSEIGE